MNNNNFFVIIILKLEMREINIVVGVNRNYIKPMSVMLISLLENNKEYKINFNIFQDDFNNEDKENILKRFNEYKNLDINYIDITNDLFKGLPTLEHISLSTYYRILAPKLLEKYDKLLYLDSDLVVDGNISELWETNIEDYAVAAVREDSLQANEERLGIPKYHKYFNAGVLLMNSKMLREGNYEDIIMDYLYKNKEILLFSDQDALNAILYNKWYEISEKWNYHNYFVDARHSNLEEIKLDKPVIIHYTGPIKPWDKEKGSVLKNIYLRYEALYNGEKIILEDLQLVHRNENYKRKIYEKLKKNKYAIKLNEVMKKNKFLKNTYYKLKSSSTPLEKVMNSFEAKKIDVKDSLFESNFDIFLSKFRDHKDYIEIEGFAFKVGFSNRKTEKYLVFYSKSREKKYFFKLGVVDREECNHIYLDKRDYSSSGFFNFIKKSEMKKGEYEIGILLKKDRLTQFKSLNKLVTI